MNDKGKLEQAKKALETQEWAKRAEDSRDFAELDAMMEEEGLEMGHDEYVVHCREFADLMTAEVLTILNAPPRKPGMPKGYHYEIKPCHICGRPMPANQYIQHIKNHHHERR